MPQLIFEELGQGVHTALETYSNVHRGSGHNSIVSTYLFEHARDIVLEYLDLSRNRYIVIFCTPRRAEALSGLLKPKDFHSVSSNEIGLPLGVKALAVKRKSLPKAIPFHTGGGTTRLVSRDKIIWASAPDRYEAGTPAIINIIGFAKALRLIKLYGKEIFRNPESEKLTVHDILYKDDLEKYSGKELMKELRQTLIGRDIMVPTVEGERPFINLDNSASTRTFTPVWKAVCQAWRQPLQVQQEIIKEVRSVCAGFVGAPPDNYDVTFTSNTTEAINLAAESLGNESDNDTEPVLLSTLLEHSSNDLPWRTASPFPLIRLSIDTEGFVDMDQMERLLCEYNQKQQYGNKRIKLVAMSGASNVLGVFNDLSETSRIVHKYGARLMVDAAQMAAHRKIVMEECGIDYLAFSAHKIYAPFGCGVLVSRKGMLSFSPDQMELIRSSGEENVAGIAALGKALVLLQRIGMDVIQEEEQFLTTRALKGLALLNKVNIYGIKDPSSPRFTQKGGVIAFDLKGFLPPRVARELAQRGGIGVRWGCHCAHILIKHLVGVPPSFERFQAIIATLFPGLRFPGLVRVSFGIENTEQDVDALILVLKKIASNPESSSAVQKQIDGFVKATAQRVYS